MHRRQFLATSLASAAALTPALPAIAAASDPLHILAYGDSNPWGLDPAAAGPDLQRYSEAQRWSGVLQAALGAGVRVATHGLMARTLATDLPEGLAGLSGEDHNGLRRLPLALLAERPVHLVVIMLGTNDLMAALQRRPDDVAATVADVATAVTRGTVAHPRVRGPRLLLVAPPPLGDPRHGPFADDFDATSVQKSLALAAALQTAAQAAGVAYADAANWTHTDGRDGVHLSPAAHRRLGRGIAGAVQRLLA